MPDAELTTPGAFVAVREDEADHEITLTRMIDRLNLEFETMVERFSDILAEASRDAVL